MVTTVLLFLQAMQPVQVVPTVIVFEAQRSGNEAEGLLFGAEFGGGTSTGSAQFDEHIDPSY
jgi:hypothetical protein